MNSYAVDVLYVIEVNLSYFANLQPKSVLGVHPKTFLLILFKYVHLIPHKLS